MPISNKYIPHVYAIESGMIEFKIAVPTTDGKKIAPHFRSGPYFKIIRINNENVSDIKLVQNGDRKYNKNMLGEHLSKISTRKHLADCFSDFQIVMVHGIDHQSWFELGHMGIEVIHTDEKEVDAAVRKYLDGKLIDKYNVNHEKV